MTNQCLWLSWPSKSFLWPKRTQTSWKMWRSFIYRQYCAKLWIRQDLIWLLGELNQLIHLIKKIAILSDLLCKGLFLELASCWVTKLCCRDMCKVIVSLQSFQGDEHFKHPLKSRPLGYVHKIVTKVSSAYTLSVKQGWWRYTTPVRRYLFVVPLGGGVRWKAFIIHSGRISQ